MYDCHPDFTEDGSEVQGRGPSAPQPVEQEEEADKSLYLCNSLLLKSNTNCFPYSVFCKDYLVLYMIYFQ